MSDTVLLLILRFISVTVALLVTCIFIEGSVAYAAMRAGIVWGPPISSTEMLVRWGIASLLWTVVLSIPRRTAAKTEAGQ